MRSPVSVISLFSGIGGFEAGFEEQGFETVLSCEIEPTAQAVLKRRFPDVQLVADVASIDTLPEVNVVTAGFPCQNLSLVGNNSGINGRDTKIVFDLFNLIARSPAAEWLVLENVPFMLWQRGGEAIEFVTKQLTGLGYRWAYRVVDARAFGLPQRRRRVLIVASKTRDPRTVLFSDDLDQPSWIEDDGKVPVGFSWTEGKLGLGWAPNCVPTIKGGSRLGVPSPPAIWFRSSGLIGTPSICDAERLQGFPPQWTSSFGETLRENYRWKLVGNALPVPFASWLASRISSPSEADLSDREKPWAERVWPNAAYNMGNCIMRVEIGEFPVNAPSLGLSAFLHDAVKPLSARASLGFLSRAKTGKLRFQDGFLDAVEAHAENMLVLQPGKKAA